MEHLMSKKVAEQPNNPFIDILIWFKENAFIWTSFILGWKTLDFTFKFLKDGRDSAIRSIVQEEINKSMAPKLDNLSEKIERLGDAVFELKNSR